MKTTNQLAIQPTANICIGDNKSRLKIYNKTEKVPTYYLEKNQEFILELFNPTQNVVLAKIILNGKAISQGGLVLRQGERIHLNRYLDVAKKFKFDTYIVSNTEEVKQAIEQNGNLKIEFYSEYIPITFTPISDWTYRPLFNYGNGTGINPWNGTVITSAGLAASTLTGNNSNSTTSFNVNNATYTTGIPVNASGSISNNVNDCTMDWMGDATVNSEPKKRVRTASLGKIETGRVEMGDISNQQLVTIDKQFNSWAFHTVEYKLLPISQKVNTTEDIKVRRYCTSCGTKCGKQLYCGNCGSKL